MPVFPRNAINIYGLFTPESMLSRKIIYMSPLGHNSVLLSVDGDVKEYNLDGVNDLLALCASNENTIYHLNRAKEYLLGLSHKI
jgi:hypothetical protein